MKYSLYSVHDCKTCFADPFISPNDDAAARGFEYAFKQNPGLMSYSPADFRLYRIGDFNSDSGEICPCVPPVFVCDLSAFLRKDVVVDA